MKTPLKSQSTENLRSWFENRHHPRYRVGQLLEWIYRHWAIEFDAMSNLPKALRNELAGHFDLNSVQSVDCRGEKDGTRKTLYRLRDGETVETVWIPSPRRRTVCLSTQVGCPIRCPFCASGRDGFVRDLAPDEIVDQVIHEAAREEEAPNRIVVMGIGEPLLNYENVIEALNVINAPGGMGIGARRITISTCGIVPGIRRLSKEGKQWNLSVSLHAPDSETRSVLVPAENRYPLEEVLEACQVYRDRTGRQVTFEYTLLKGINDSQKQAFQLASISRELDAKINLIPYNPVAGLPFECPDDGAIEEFVGNVEEKRGKITVRREKGGSIDAACGQLRRRP
ncbi:MAG: 23S rRNA (adenine(2503)-C(2))-methyltransferase RlmN [Candidatus Eisenbacteria sp.]|nr:23S rRNA (adenine(2503)-C(2))-methyltransferase RlmN [Candidatus Eisenbacteria bacterium]